MSNEFSTSGFISDLFVDEKKSELNDLKSQNIRDSREVVLERLSGLMEDEMDIENIQTEENQIMEKTETQSIGVEPRIYTK